MAGNVFRVDPPVRLPALGIAALIAVTAAAAPLQAKVVNASAYVRQPENTLREQKPLRPWAARFTPADPVYNARPGVALQKLAAYPYPTPQDARREWFPLSAKFRQAALSTPADPVYRYTGAIIHRAAYVRAPDPIPERAKYAIPPSAGRNLLVCTESVDDASWLKNDATVIANATTAPDASNTADKLVEGAGTGDPLAQQLATTSAAGGTPHTFSAYAKAAERNWLRLVLTSLSFGSSTSCWFNLATGVVGTGVGSIADAGGGWWRCSVVCNLFAGDTQFYAATEIQPFDNAGSYIGDGTSGLYVWGAQLEVSGLTAYEPVPCVLVPYARADRAAFVRPPEQRTEWLENLAPWAVPFLQIVAQIPAGPSPQRAAYVRPPEQRIEWLDLAPWYSSFDPKSAPYPGPNVRAAYLRPQETRGEWETIPTLGAPFTASDAIPATTLARAPGRDPWFVPLQAAYVLPATPAPNVFATPLASIARTPETRTEAARQWFAVFAPADPFYVYRGPQLQAVASYPYPTPQDARREWATIEPWFGQFGAPPQFPYSVANQTASYRRPPDQRNEWLENLAPWFSTFAPADPIYAFAGRVVQPVAPYLRDLAIPQLSVRFTAGTVALYTPYTTTPYVARVEAWQQQRQPTLGPAITASDTIQPTLLARADSRDIVAPRLQPPAIVAQPVAAFNFLTAQPLTAHFRVITVPDLPARRILAAGTAPPVPYARAQAAYLRDGPPTRAIAFRVPEIRADKPIPVPTPPWAAYLRVRWESASFVLPARDLPSLLDLDTESRIYTVAAVDRNYEVTVEDRRFTIGAVDRKFSIAALGRNYTIVAEGRTYTVSSELRKFNITGPG